MHLPTQRRPTGGAYLDRLGARELQPQLGDEPDAKASRDHSELQVVIIDGVRDPRLEAGNRTRSLNEPPIVRLPRPDDPVLPREPFQADGIALASPLLGQRKQQTL